MYEGLTGNRVVALATLNDRGDFLQVAGNVPDVVNPTRSRRRRASTARCLAPCGREGASQPRRRSRSDRAKPAVPGTSCCSVAAERRRPHRSTRCSATCSSRWPSRYLLAGWSALLAAFALAARIRRLERATRRIAAGNLATPVTDDGRDEIHELARAFDDMRRRLERTDRPRREFIANASHELRTPLFALGGFLELLEDEEDPADAARVRRHDARPGVAADAARDRPARPVAARRRRRPGRARRGRHRRRRGDSPPRTSPPPPSSAAARWRRPAPHPRSPSPTRRGSPRSPACWSTTRSATTRLASR